MENQYSSWKDFEVLENKIEKMISIFTKAEKQGKECSKKYLDWIKEISSPEFN